VKIAEPATDIRPQTALQIPSWRFVATALLGVAALLAFCVVTVRAQGPAGSDTPNPTAIPGGAAAIGEPTSVWTPSASKKVGGMTGPVQQPQSTYVNVGGETVSLPNAECARLVAEALQRKAVVPVPDSSGSSSSGWCADAMNRALELQRTRPEPTGWPTPGAGDAGSFNVLRRARVSGSGREASIACASFGR
jgi:hypothetical protein